MDEMLQSNTSTSTAPSAGTNNSSNTGSEVPIIGTNTTVNIVGDQESVNKILETLNSRTEPVFVGTNATIQIDTTKSGQSQQSGEVTSSSDQAPRTDSDPNYEYTFSEGGESTTGDSNTSSGDGSNPIVGTNASISDSGIPAGDSGNPFAGGFGSDTPSSDSSDPLTGGADAAGGGSPFPGGGNPFNAPQNDENYQWNFMEETSGEGDMEALFQRSPWGQLSEVGITSFQDIFGDDPTLAEGNPFGGNPMGGGNFGSGSASAGGGNPFGGDSPIGGDAPLTSGDAASDASTYTWDV